LDEQECFPGSGSEIVKDALSELSDAEFFPFYERFSALEVNAPSEGKEEDCLAIVRVIQMCC